MKKLPAVILPAFVFTLVTLLSFFSLSASGKGFPFLNPGPRQLLVSDDQTSSPDGIPDMIYVAGGSFPMGSPDGKFSSFPVRAVTVSDFFISRYEITFFQYDNYCRSEGLPFPPDGGYGREGRPVGNVSWYDVAGYCNWLSRLEDLEPCYRITENPEGGLPVVTCDYSRKGYRLPTEAEWEYAASGGRKSRSYSYAGSNDVDEVAWYFDNAQRYPNPVGEKKPNELGLFDMSGNAYEWTNNRLTEDYSDLPDGAVDPTGPQEEGARTVRGGSCFFDSWGCLVCYRKGLRQECRLPYVGFRIVRREVP
ncbi:MAG: SUMF1/EgtB/PvdO family nonheme iron enzyme [Spirochaetales bacterium]|nr:SUMF1/EgtB/PvdO family nonheme iron enzyme [Spirochaetales bacterium]